jgi:hypothetical protein
MNHETRPHFSYADFSALNGYRPSGPWPRLLLRGPGLRAAFGSGISPWT